MPGFHSVTHVPTLQQAQTIVREQSLFGTGKEVDVEALKVAEFVDLYCDSHITTRFPEDLSRLLIAAFKAGQDSVMQYVPATIEKAEKDVLAKAQLDLQSDIRYLIAKTENCECILEQDVRPTLSFLLKVAPGMIGTILATLIAVICVYIVVTRS